MYKVQPPNYVTQDSQEDLFSSGNEEKCIAVFQTVHKVEVGYRLVDLVRKTESKIFSTYEANKLALLPSEFDRRGESPLPFVILSELYVGFRIVNLETE